MGSIFKVRPLSSGTICRQLSDCPWIALNTMAKKKKMSFEILARKGFFSQLNVLTNYLSESLSIQILILLRFYQSECITGHSVVRFCSDCF